MVNDKITKPKPKKSLKFCLDNNVTYAFEKLQSVNELINPEHISIRKILADDDKLRSIIKSDKPRPPKPVIVKVEPIQLVQ